MDKLTTVAGMDAKSAASLAGTNTQLDKAKDLSKQEVKDAKGVEKAAGGFEALLLHQMMESMWSTVDFAGMFNEKGNEASFFRDMLSQAIADNTSKGRGIGVKSFLTKELVKNYDASKK